MGRKPTISREQLLEIAERIVNNEGPQALTIDALAKAAGISKGGVQYSFSSKDALIKALVDRWTGQFDEQVVDLKSAEPVAYVKSYIAIMRSSGTVFDAKVAGMMINWMQNPANRREVAQWYQTVLRNLGTGIQSKTARLVFLAVEGLLALRMSGVEDDALWDDALTDIENFLDENSGS